jgi:hypothetical protein
MYKERSIEDHCLLCKEKKADKTNSHIVPASMLKHMIGKRDYEESYLIDSKEVIMDQYFGRSNLKNDNTNIKSHQFAKDYWFCTKCEKRLGNVEDKVAPRIEHRIRNSSDQGFLELTPNGHQYFNYNGNGAELELFIYSIVWRLNLYYQLSADKEIMDVKWNDYLRVILLNNLPWDAKTKVSKNWETIPHIILRPNTSNFGRSLVFTDDRYLNPNLYFITDFVFLFFPTGFSENFQNDDFQLSGFLKKELLFQGESTHKIGLIESDKWESITACFTNKALMISRMIELVSEKLGISQQLAEMKLVALARAINATGKSSRQSFEDAYMALINK